MFGKSIAVLDGSDRGALREWVNVVECVGRLAQLSELQLIKFAISNSTGTLHKIISNALLNEQVETWDRIKNIINKTLLTPDDRSQFQDRYS